MNELPRQVDKTDAPEFESLGLNWSVAPNIGVGVVLINKTQWHVSRSVIKKRKGLHTAMVGTEMEHCLNLAGGQVGLIVDAELGTG